MSAFSFSGFSGFSGISGFSGFSGIVIRMYFRDHQNPGKIAPSE